MDPSGFTQDFEFVGAIPKFGIDAKSTHSLWKSGRQPPPTPFPFPKPLHDPLPTFKTYLILVKGHLAGCLHGYMVKGHLAGCLHGYIVKGHLAGCLHGYMVKGLYMGT